MSDFTHQSRIDFSHETPPESQAANERGGDLSGEADSPLPTDVTLQTLLMVNVVYVGKPLADGGRGDWVLVDAGLPGTAARILAFARERFGDNPPRAIVLTHGHFDHIGALHALLEAWPDVKVYAHRLELPYLTGKASYPPPDPTVGGGLFSRLSPLFPKGPHDFGHRIEALPEDGTVPTLAEWKWIATPGHSPGHVSFFRACDRTLIAGDAFVTQKQESLVGVLTAAIDVKGPPMYFTPDWESSRQSVELLANLHPASAYTGHGRFVAGQRLEEELSALARDFDHRGKPAHGRYVDTPAITDESGVVSLPPKPTDLVPYVTAGVALVVAGVALSKWANRDQSIGADE